MIMTHGASDLAGLWLVSTWSRQTTPTMTG